MQKICMQKYICEKDANVNIMMSILSYFCKGFIVNKYKNSEINL